LQGNGEAELLLVRAYMQAGEYRRALAFGAHIAGDHPELPAGVALYAWLLRAGGQAAASRTVIASATRRSPADLIVSEAGSRLANPWPVPSPPLLRAPWRMAPYAVGRSVSFPSRLAATGVLIDHGVAALVASPAIDRAHRLWVRNGL